MQQTEQTQAGWDGAERRRVEAVVETLATLRSEGENLEEVAHDARNMVTALGLYCDLLQEPGVLAPPYMHYGNELRLVAAASPGYARQSGPFFGTAGTGRRICVCRIAIPGLGVPARHGS